MAFEYEIVIIIAVNKVYQEYVTPLHVCVCRWTKGNLNLFAACIRYIVASSPVETPSRRFVVACRGLILFQICYEYNVRRLNIILIIGHLRDTDIRQCRIYTITQI